MFDLRGVKFGYVAEYLGSLTLSAAIAIGCEPLGNVGSLAHVSSRIDNGSPQFRIYHPGNSE